MVPVKHLLACGTPRILVLAILLVQWQDNLQHNEVRQIVKPFGVQRSALCMS